MNRLPHLTQRHLSDEQMLELLDAPDQTASAPRLHLAACSACRTEFAGLRDSFASFRVATTGFAAAEAPKYAPRHIVPAQTHRLRRHAIAASFATAVALMVSLVHLHPPAPARVPVSPAIQVTAANDSDEALLDGIQNDLSTSLPPSLEPLSVAAGSGEATTKN